MIKPKPNPPATDPTSPYESLAFARTIANDSANLIPASQRRMLLGLRN